MLNQTVLVGKIAKDIVLEELDNGQKACDVILSISRNTKNNKGVYDYDFITCKLFGGMAENITKYCQKGDIIGVKGNIQSNINEITDNLNKKIDISIIAEKVTFLSSKSKDDQELER